MDNTNYGIIWPNDEVSSLDVLEVLSANANILYKKTYNFNNKLSELVFDIYSFDKGLKVFKAKNILEKLERLKSKNNKDVIFVGFSCNTFKDTIDLRNQIRKKFKNKTSCPAFDIFHAATSMQERQHVKNIVLSKSTIDSYNVRNNMSQNLITLLNPLKQWASTKSISLNDICIVGGAVLDLYGYKFCDDIDIVLPNKLRDGNYGPRAEKLVPGVDIVKKAYSKKEGVGKWYTDDELIYNNNLFVIARGIKFANLEIVKERKNYSRRKKDIDDLYKIENNIKV